MVVSDEGYVMLLAEPFFKNLHHAPGLRHLAPDRGAHLPVLRQPERGGRAREESDRFRRSRRDARAEPRVHVWQELYDLDGHHWEVMWMDPKAVDLGPEEYLLASQQK